MALANASVPRELLENPPLAAPRQNWVKGSLPNLDADIVKTLEQCLAYSPTDRPSIAEVEKVLRRHLLKDKHKGLMVMGAQVKELNSQNRRAKITSSVGAEISIEYDGYDFKVASYLGDVTVNNDPVSVGYVMPGASVITFGSVSNRGFVTFDISNPEVVS